MRTISWVSAALRDFEEFPVAVQAEMAAALDIAAAGETPDNAKPLKGFAEAVFKISVAFRTDAWRTIYALKIGHDIWVLHAFQKKSKKGIKTPKHEIDLIRQRIKRLKGR